MTCLQSQCSLTRIYKLYSMIISASRRTDLPAFFPKETIEKIISMNNDNQQRLFKINLVEAVVFWTKNARPIIPYLNELDELKIPYYFQYTMNDYPGLEPNIPKYWNRVETFIELSELIGKDRVIWRYDPFLKSTIPIEYSITNVLNRFKVMGNCIHKYTNKLVFSFLDPYPKLPLGLTPPTKEEENQIINFILEANKTWNLKLATCAEIVDNSLIEPNKCIDPVLLQKLGVEIPNINDKDKAQRKTCGCYPSKDIGEYHTCKHDCTYCYAR